MRRCGVANIFDVSKIIFPVYRSKNHCALCVIDLEKELTVYYDSLGYEYKELGWVVRKYLSDEHSAKVKRGRSFERFVIIYPKELPQQNNTFDCGIFTMKFLEWIVEEIPLKGEFIFDSSNIATFREKIMFEIIQERLMADKNVISNP